MSCRAGSLYRQAPPCLWITDDVLAEAFDRFARVSLTNRRNGGRRYGSHVPGPMEAHRRLARRRMGVAAVERSLPPTGLDFGPLFGWVGGGSHRPLDDWKWEPPGIREKERDWLRDLLVRDDVVKKKKNKQEAPLATLDRVVDPTPEDAVQESRQAFDELLAKTESQDMEEVLSFLRAPGNETDARNTLRLAEYLFSTALSKDTFDRFYKLLLDKIRLDTLAEDELPSILHVILRSPGVEQYTNELSSILDAIPFQEALIFVCVHVTQHLLEESAQSSTPILQAWLRVLRTAQCSKGNHDLHFLWNAIYHIMAATLTDFSLLSGHWSSLGQLDLSRVLLRHWIPHYVTKCVQEHNTDMVASSLWEEKCFTRPSTRQPSVGELSRDFENIHATWLELSDRPREVGNLAELVATLHFHGIPHHTLCDRIFEVLMLEFDSKTVWQTLYELTFVGNVGIDNQLAAKLVHYFIRNGCVNWAAKVFVRISSLPLSACYELPIAMAKSQLCSAKRIWRVLQRQTPEDTVHCRSDRNDPRNRLTQDHVDVIHVVAAHFANSPEMTSSRSAFRRVWECYLYLHDRHAPMRPMLSRALVTAGVTRPFLDLQRVSTVKFRYILGLVARIEGKSVADALDRLVWKLWNEEVLPRIIKTQRGRRLGGAVPEPRALTNSSPIAATRGFRHARNWLFERGSTMASRRLAKNDAADNGIHFRTDQSLEGHAFYEAEMDALQEKVSTAFTRSEDTFDDGFAHPVEIQRQQSQSFLEAEEPTHEIIHEDFAMENVARRLPVENTECNAGVIFNANVLFETESHVPYNVEQYQEPVARQVLCGSDCLSVDADASDGNYAHPPPPELHEAADEESMAHLAFEAPMGFWSGNQPPHDMDRHGQMAAESDKHSVPPEAPQAIKKQTADGEELTSEYVRQETYLPFSESSYTGASSQELVHTTQADESADDHLASERSFASATRAYPSVSLSRRPLLASQVMGTEVSAGATVRPCQPTSLKGEAIEASRQVNVLSHHRVQGHEVPFDQWKQRGYGMETACWKNTTDASAQDLITHDFLQWRRPANAQRYRLYILWHGRWKRMSSWFQDLERWKKNWTQRKWEIKNLEARLRAAGTGRAGFEDAPAVSEAQPVPEFEASLQVLAQVEESDQAAWLAERKPYDKWKNARQKMEMHCWANTTKQSLQTMPILDFLEWRLTRHGRYRLFLLWNGTWQTMSQLERACKCWKKEGTAPQAEINALEARLQAATTGRARFETLRLRRIG